MADQRVSSCVKFSVPDLFHKLNESPQFPNRFLQDLSELIRFPSFLHDRFLSWHSDLFFLHLAQFFLCHAFRHCPVHHMIPFLPEIIINSDLLCLWIVLSNLSGRQIRTVLIKHLQLLCRIFYQFIDKIRIVVFHFFRKLLGLEFLVFWFEKIGFINFSLLNDPASRPDLSTFIQDLFLRPDVFPVFIIEQIPCSNLSFRNIKRLPFGKDQMNVKIGFCLIMVQSAYHRHIILLHKLCGKIFQQHIRIILDHAWRQHDNQLSRLNAFALCTAFSEILLIFF